MSQRTFKAKTDVIEAARIKRGWTLFDLANKAIVSSRTLDSVMAGAPAVISTYRKIATALAVPVESIIQGNQEAEKPKGKRLKMSLTISVPYEDFDECKQLLTMDGLLRRLLGNIDLQPEAAKGSTMVTVFLNGEQREALLTYAPDALFGGLRLKPELLRLAKGDAEAEALVNAITAITVEEIPEETMDTSKVETPRKDMESFPG
jgi:transcriptional regulator with XRE-family HTH domain